MEKNYLLTDSCENYILRKHSLIVAAFPSIVIFGEIENTTKFKEFKSFKFNSFEIKFLLQVIGEIVAFFNGDILDDQLNKKKILVNSNCNIDYFWQGNNFENRKSVTFSIETKTSQTFSVNFNLEDLNNFNYLIKRCLLSSLCLKDVNEQFILNVIEISENEILASKKNYSLATNIVQTFLSKLETKEKPKSAAFIELLVYYNEIILVLKDFSMLCFTETD